MVFNSLQFVLFFALVLSLYWTLPPSPRGGAGRRNVLLLVASYFFYAQWNWRFLGLIVVSTCVDYVIGRLLDDEQRRHRGALLATSMIVNLGILGAFKYANFFLDSFDQMASRFGLEASSPAIDVLLPVGISFYTFQTMSYTIDVYRGRLAPVRSFLTFATFVAYFPQLVAGPIERARDLLPQIEEPRSRPDRTTIESGIGLILLGLVKKVVLADGIAGVADRAFQDPGGISWIAAVAGVLAFAVQIYGDFSGYTDIARGVSRLLGIELTLNFTQPYLSRNITEFWRRWHITLSNWLRDYLYIPLGGNRKGPRRTYVNLMTTMLLGGLWHGASWNFVLWGGIHGLLLVLHRLFLGGRVTDAPLVWRDAPRVLATATAVCLAWIPFRAAGFGDTVDVVRALAFQGGTWSASDVVVTAVLLGMMLAIDLLARRAVLRPQLLAARPQLSGALVTASLLAVVLFSGGAPRPFVYFQF